MTGVVKKRSTRHHDLDLLAGTWSSHDVNEFRSATEQFDLIDAALCKRSVFFFVFRACYSRFQD